MGAAPRSMVSAAPAAFRSRSARQPTGVARLLHTMEVPMDAWMLSKAFG